MMADDSRSRSEFLPFVSRKSGNVYDGDNTNMPNGQLGPSPDLLGDHRASEEVLDDLSSEASSNSIFSNTTSSVPASSNAANEVGISDFKSSEHCLATSSPPTSSPEIQLAHQMHVIVIKPASNDLINTIAEISAAWVVLLGSYTASPSVSLDVGFQDDAEFHSIAISTDGNLTTLDLVRAIKLQFSGFLPDAAINKLFIRGSCIWRSNQPRLPQSSKDQSALTLAFELNDEHFVIKAHFDESLIHPKQVRRILLQFEHILEQLSLDESFDKTLSELELLSHADIREMSLWASAPIPTIDLCVHHLIELQARQQPQAIAVAARDIEINYHVLDELSGKLAHYLKSLGVGPEVLVPFCFEKSAWAVIAMIGILKAGGACVGLDPKHPMRRLNKIIQDSRAEIIITSKQHSELLIGLPVAIVPIDEAFLQALPIIDSPACTTVHSKNPAYVTFTSGTTGEPKGIVIEHGSVCVSGSSQQAALRLGPKSRVLQFAAYTFDISNGDVLNTLMSGGCICVPSEDERSNDLEGFINRMGVNWACLTPSVASLLQPSSVPTLETLVLCGEPISQEIVYTWANSVFLVDAYGPAETTILCTSFPGVGQDTSSSNLGWNMGARTWIADSLDHNKLCPLGCIGEILIEGPLVARGYLNDPEKTIASFIHDPLWTRNPLLSGASQRLYKSGDLGYFNTDGSITFVGRKDKQVKIRGQRVELLEVEHHLRLVLPETVSNVIVEVVSDNNYTSLVAFVYFGIPLDDSTDPEHQLDTSRHDLSSATAGVVAKLSDSLPAHMIPSSFIPLGKLPLNQSGKLDRKILRHLARDFLAKNKAKHSQTTNRRRPSTDLECQMQRHWAQILKLDALVISADDNFIKLGGDSLSAMKLVAACRADGILLSVASVFQSPDLSTLAANATFSDSPQLEVVPFTLLERDTISILYDEALAQCTDIHDADVIEDMYPCTPQQEGLFAMSLKQRGSYVAQDVTELPKGTDISWFQNAWKQTIQACAILRTRIIQSLIAGSVQVVVTSQDPWIQTSVENEISLKDYLERDRNVNMGFGQPLSRYAIVKNADTGAVHFVWTIHHACYDGWSMPLIKSNVDGAYAGKSVLQPTKFNQFVQHVLNVKTESTTQFWKLYFKDAQSPIFPYISPPTYQPHAQSILDYKFSISRKANTSFTLPTLIRAAWALLIGRYVESNDVSFGVTLAGRNAPLSNLDTLIGPTIATLPVRIRWSRDMSVDEYLQNVQNQSVAMIPFEHSGLQNIQSASEEARIACRFQSHLLIQPLPAETSFGIFSAGNLLAGELSDYGSYALIVQCLLAESDVVVRATYDEKIIDRSQVQRYMNLLEHLVHQLGSVQGSRTINDIETISSADEAEIMQWNSSPLAPVDSSFHVIFKGQEQLRPDALAVCSWDGSMTYTDLDELSTRLAHYMVAQMNVKPGTFVPLCFEKSVWTMVAIMATFKAGAAIVPLDPFHPLSRRLQIISESQANIMLCSGEYRNSFLSTCDHVLVIDRHFLESLPLPATTSDDALPTTPSTAPLYGLFTSGSTGVPKGVIIEHGAFLSSATAYGNGMFMTSDSRVLLYSSYSFDISILEMLTPLIFGGCICVVSDKDRLDDLGGAMSQLKVNWSLLTPTVARTINPKTVPSLEVLLLGGEPLEREDIAQWAPYIKHLINAYGTLGVLHEHTYFDPFPAFFDVQLRSMLIMREQLTNFDYNKGPTECSVVSSAFVDLDLKSDPRNIGQTFNAHYWITDVNNHNRLMSIGAVGELLIEGPILARGYLNNAEQTKQSFIEDPEWSKTLQTRMTTQSGNPTIRRRFYKTGDLVRYDILGNVIYVGRKDHQVKLRGQRIELGEIQYQILRLVPEVKSVVVEVISTGNENSHPMLVAFVCLHRAESNGRDLLAAKTPAIAAFLSSIRNLENNLLALLPRYMIPSLFLPLFRLPMTVSHKVDRKQLHALIRSLSTEELGIYKPEAAINRKPSTPAEKDLQTLWAGVLKTSADEISAEDNFFSLGGDSILAIHLVGACRANGVSLSVPQIFQTPKLADMALLTMKDDRSSSLVDIPPFQLLAGGLDDLFESAARQFAVPIEDIEDMYPCTPLQESLIISSVKTPGSYVAQFVFELPEDIDLSRFRRAVEAVVNASPILRTRIFQSPSSQLLQVVLHSQNIDWETQPDIKIALNKNHRTSMTLNKQLSTFGLIEAGQSGKGSFVWTIHHALYDGWSMVSIRKRIDAAYKSLNNAHLTEVPFNRFVGYAIDSDRDASDKYWREYLDGAVRPSFPPVPQGHPIKADAIFKSELNLTKRSCSSEITLSTIIRAAWAILVQSYSGSSDVVFGATLSGRDTVLEGIENISGPTIATVPIRVILDSKDSKASSFLQRIQDRTAEMIPYQHTGMKYIQSVSGDAFIASKFQNLLVVQPAETSLPGVCSSWSTLADDVNRFNSYALMVQCSLHEPVGGESTILVETSYDSGILDTRQIQRIIQQFGYIIDGLLSSDGSTVMGAIELISPEDKKELAIWNNPERLHTVDACLHEMFEKQVVLAPDLAAVSSWDGQLTYGELNEFANQLCSILRTRGVIRGSPVALCFEHSKWMTVASMATLKAGGTLIALDHKHPVNRLEDILSSTNVKILLTSRSCSTLLRTAPMTIVVDSTTLDEMTPTDLSWPSGLSSPSDVAVVVFTSGTTGMPKGYQLEHKAICSSAVAFGTGMFINSQTRVFQFGSHAHDAMVLELLVPLIFGACICIPNEEERLSKTAEVMRRLAVNWTFLTPSVARLINPAEVPELATLVLGGEALSGSDITQWSGHVQHLINGYGPGECSIFSSANIDLVPSDEASNIGKTFNAHYWVTLPDDVNRLCPIGGIGELLIDGPILGRGYFNQPDLTAAAFIERPDWAKSWTLSSTSKMYRTGDLVCYNSNGSVKYLGRIDNQVKIRGQRTELAEVEHQLRLSLPKITGVVVEMVELKSSDSRKAMIAFLSSGDSTGLDDEILARNQIDVTMCKELDLLHENLADSLPVYMIPSHVLLFRSFPLTRSGKTDRRKLSLLASNLSLEELNAYASSSPYVKVAPSTPTEIVLRAHWAATLRIDIDRIGRDDNFFRLGGDSIAAMYLVTKLRTNGHSLLISSVFQAPVLQSMAKMVESGDVSVVRDPDPFTLLGHEVSGSSICEEVLSHCDMSEDVIEDIYPCTPMQEGLIALSIKRPGAYIAQFKIELSAVGFDVGKFQAAWEQIVELAPILRTRIFTTKGRGSMQVVFREPIAWAFSHSIDEYLKQDRKTVMTLGGKLARYAIISDSGKQYFVWTLHHSLYDAWSIRSILRNVNHIYTGKPICRIANFSRYIRHTLEVDRDLGEASQNFWQSQLIGASALDFPPTPSANYQPEPDSNLADDFPLPPRRQSSCTISTLIWAAWTLVISRYTGSLDVVFGTILSGRFAPVPDIEDLLGPTLNTVPIRHQVHHNQTIDEYLEGFQAHSNSIIPFQTLGLQRIQRLGKDAQAACQFRSMLVVQPKVDEAIEETFKFAPTGDEYEFASYALTIECTLTETHLNVSAAYDSHVIDQPQMRRVIRGFKHAIAQLCKGGSSKLAALPSLSPEDFQEIAEWNRPTFPPVEKYIDEIFQESVLLFPEATAIDAWDGQLTYSDLDRHSTALACLLVNIGIVPEVLVPLCFAKSKWVVVAMLAVAKSGGAFVPMEPSQPVNRLKSILSQTQSKTVLCSEQYHSLLQPLSENVIVVNDSLFEQAMPTDLIYRHPRSTQDALYVIFTSGTTGTPKGVVITHQAYCSSSTAYAKELVDSNTRALQFASYSFDASILEIFTALSAGGCVCIPSEQNRLDDIAGTIAAMAINWAALTPSTARLIEPNSVPTLKTLLTGGEALSWDDIPRWKGHAELFHMYGPTETSVVASRFAGITENTHPNNIGLPFASNFWIVDSSDHDILLPVGAIGELLIDGAILAREYLHDPMKTATSFISDPVWLPKHRSPSRMYKTGDLVRYNSDGTINFLGRKDTQIKLRGLRIQLGEVEYHLQRALPDVGRIVAELVHVEGKTMLVAFLPVEGDKSDPRNISDQELFDVDRILTKNLAAMLSEVEESLSTVMLAHMMPSAYIPIRRIPTAVSGKTDRGRLKRFVSGLSAAQLDAYKIYNEESRVEPSTAMERELQTTWASIIGLEIEQIGAKDNFFKLGGDSVLAISLVGVLRSKGISLSAAHIFQNPKLCDMALFAVTTHDGPSDDIEPFSLIGEPSSAQQIRLHAAAECGITEDSLEDIYPCTALQEGLMAMTIRTPGAYVAQSVIPLPLTVDIERFRAAWDITIKSNPILRTRIVQGPTTTRGTPTGFLQVVVKETAAWHFEDSLDAFLDRSSAPSMRFGTPLTRYSIIQDAASGTRYFAWTLHHALYDAWSMSLISNFLTEAYNNQKPTKLVGFNQYIKHLIKSNVRQAAEDYWRSALQDAVPSNFPPSAPTTDEPQPDASLHHIINVPSVQDASADFTISTIVRAAWALLISKYTDSQDVVFGAILAGRTASIPGIEEIAGPTINTVPVRLVIDFQKPVTELLRQVQNHSTEIIPFETLGLQKIQHLSESAHAACQFQNLLIVQPPPANDVNSICPAQMTAAGDLFDNLRSYALAIQCTLIDTNGKREIEVHAGFDSKSISETQMRRVLDQFDYLIQQICHATKSHLVKELDLISPNDRIELERWFGNPIPSTQLCLDEMFEISAHQNVGRSAINSWDGNFTYEELNDAVDSLAKLLIDIGVRAETKVPLLFQKSRWAVVAMLAVVKAGGAIVPLETMHPRARLESIMRAIDATVVLCSPDQQEWLSKSHSKVVVVDSSVDLLPKPIETISGRTTLSSALYIIFTSGSTGLPKGVVIEHRAFGSSVPHHAKQAFFGPSMRNLQLASYSFGAAVAEIFSTLLHGGCLCIVPNEARANLPGVVKEMNINFMFMSPTFARLIPPQAIPSVKTLIFGSEAMSTADIEKWCPHVQIVQGYGQTECSTIAATFPSMTPDIHPRNVGSALAARFWIVDPSNQHTLAPLGAVGELIIEGPIVARGYLNDPEKTAAAFIKPPAWRQQFEVDNDQRMYKTGDLARFHDDGTLIFMGRKDTQVKLRGQRVELGEIEYHIQRFIPSAKGVVVELVEIQTKKGKGHATLVAFVSLGPDIVQDNEIGTANKAITEAFLPLLSNLAAQLSEVLPSYMIPSAYLPLGAVPSTTSGKVDRLRLREKASRLSVEQLAFYSLSNIVRREPATPLEKNLQKLWAEVLDIDIEQIRADSNFLQLGGDSINAIKLVAACRSQGLILSVAEIFKHPTLSQMAEILQLSPTTQPSEHTRLSSLTDLARVGLLREVIKQRIASDESEVEDILEATYMQSLFVAAGLMEQSSKTNYITLQFRETLDANRLEAACRALVSQHQILRTIFIPYEQQLMQVILRSLAVQVKQYKCGSEIDEFISVIIKADSTEVAHFGRSFLRFMIFDGGAYGFRLTIRINHAQFDGMSFPRMIEDLAIAYEKMGGSSALPQFSDFIYHAGDIHDTGAVDFYRNLLSGSTMTTLAISQVKPSRIQPVNEGIVRKILHTSFPEHGITFSIVLKAAWSVVLAEMTGTRDVVFGYLVAGRNLPMPSIDTVVGPCINITPIRVQHLASTTLELLEQVRDQNLEAMPYENYSLEKIVRNCTEWPRWTRCSTIVQCQHIAVESGAFSFGGVECELTATNPPSDLADLIVDAQPSGSDGTEMSISFLFNTDKISTSIVEQAAERLVTYITDIRKNISATLPLLSQPQIEAGTVSLESPNNLCEASTTLSDDSGPRVESTVRKVWNKVLAPSSGLSESTTNDTPFFEIWGSLIGAAYLAECYGAEIGIDISMEEIVEHPSMRLQSELVRKKWVMQNRGSQSATTEHF